MPRGLGGEQRAVDASEAAGRGRGGNEEATDPDAGGQHDGELAVARPAGARAAGRAGGQPGLVQLVDPHAPPPALQDAPDEECAGAEPGGRVSAGPACRLGSRQGVPAAAVHRDYALQRRGHPVVQLLHTQRFPSPKALPPPQMAEGEGAEGVQ